MTFRSIPTDKITWKELLPQCCTFEKSKKCLHSSNNSDTMAVSKSRNIQVHKIAWTQGYPHQTRKKRVVYCKFYLQFTHSAVQKGKIQFCCMTKTLHRKDWLKHFTTRFLRVMHWITKHNFVSSKSISKTQETCFYSFGVKMQDINKARIGFREI